jgi:hypothetical protein
LGVYDAAQQRGDKAVMRMRALRPRTTTAFAGCERLVYIGGNDVRMSRGWGREKGMTEMDGRERTEEADHGNG